MLLSLKGKSTAENTTLLRARFTGLCKEVHLEKKIEMEEPKK